MDEICQLQIFSSFFWKKKRNNLVNYGNMSGFGFIILLLKVTVLWWFATLGYCKTWGKIMEAHFDFYCFQTITVIHTNQRDAAWTHQQPELCDFGLEL